MALLPQPPISPWVFWDPRWESPHSGFYVASGTEVRSPGLAVSIFTPEPSQCPLVIMSSQPLKHRVVVFCSAPTSKQQSWVVDSRLSQDQALGLVLEHQVLCLLQALLFFQAASSGLARQELRHTQVLDCPLLPRLDRFCCSKGKV